MQKITRCIALVLALLLLAAPAMAVTPADWDSSQPDVLNVDMLYSESAVLIDAETHEVLFAKQPMKRMYPASTTKIMTLLLALESGISLDTVITIPKAANDVPSDSSFVPVLPGEQMTFQDLLYGTMMASGNDGANAIAALVSGSVEGFVLRMNQRAAEIGCTGTHFANAHGYMDENHYSTATDLALIAAEAMKNEDFRTIVSAVSYTMAPTARRGQKELTTRISLLKEDSGYYYEDCVGIKTGFHTLAGQCYVGAAEHTGTTLICVALGSDPEQANYKWRDAIRMFEYGWTRYSEFSLVDLYNHTSYDMTSVVIPNAAQNDPMRGTLNLQLVKVSDENYSVMVRDEEDMLPDVMTDFTSRLRIDLRQSLSAPIDEGEIVGSLTYVTPEGETLTGLLVASRSVSARADNVSIGDYIPILSILNDSVIRLAGIVLIALILLLIILLAARSKAKQRERRQIYRRKRREYERRVRAGEFDPEPKKTVREKQKQEKPQKARKDDLFDI